MTIHFATRLQKDGSLHVPQTAIEELGLRPGDAVRVSLDATEDANLPAGGNGDSAGDTSLARAVFAMTHRTPEEIARELVTWMKE